MTPMTPFIRDLAAYWPQILTGLENTLLLTGIISVTGFLGGIAVFYLTVVSGKTCRKWTERYISFFIGTPLLVYLFLMYYGLPELGVRLSPLLVSVIGFTLNVSAYNARYLTTAYNGLDRMEIEAAGAQGFTLPETFRFVILPQALRFSAGYRFVVYGLVIVLTILWRPQGLVTRIPTGDKFRMPRWGSKAIVVPEPKQPLGGDA